MPRPPKCKRVCNMPKCNRFGALDKGEGEKNVINMTVEEFEAIRLMDKEGNNQETAAEIMRVARTTLQRIYDEARKKLATALVDGGEIHITGGNYVLCGGEGDHGCCHNCRRKAVVEDENLSETKPKIVSYRLKK